MNELQALLRERIGDMGPMSIAEYMRAALTDPTHGYYTGRDPLGVEGDFITAPEISQIFGELCGLWLAVNWQAMGQPDPVNLVELGPGRGTLMSDIIRATQNVPGFADAIRVHLVEASPALRKAQEDALAVHELAVPPMWHDSLDTVAEGPMLMVANEFFDALPIRQLMRAGDYWLERCVDTDPDPQEPDLNFVLVPPGDRDDPILPPGLVDGENGEIVEICPDGQDIAHAIGTRIVNHGGVALIIDYGHAESAPGETLQAVKDHAFHDVLTDPGEADITAHVDFAALAHAAFTAGAQAWGPVAQGRFLTALGLEARANALMSVANAEQQHEIETGAKRLIDPEQMGTLFKVMAITAKGEPAPPVFE